MYEYMYEYMHEYIHEYMYKYMYEYMYEYEYMYVYMFEHVFVIFTRFLFRLISVSCNNGFFTYTSSVPINIVCAFHTSMPCLIKKCLTAYPTNATSLSYISIVVDDDDDDDDAFTLTARVKFSLYM